MLAALLKLLQMIDITNGKHEHKRGKAVFIVVGMKVHETGLRGSMAFLSIGLKMIQDLEKLAVLYRHYRKNFETR